MKSEVCIRVGDIGFCSINLTKGEFVHYSKNGYSGKLQEYLSNGWTDAGDDYISNDAAYGSIHKRMFEEQQPKRSIATLKYNYDHRYFELQTAGRSLLELNLIQNFIDAYKLADDKMNELINTKSNDV